jgi:hypothetical protein
VGLETYFKFCIRSSEEITNTAPAIRTLLSACDVCNLITLLHGLSPRANYTDRATAACRRSYCQLFADRGCHVASVTDPYGRILDFLDRSRYFSIKYLLSCTHEAEWTLFQTH